LFGLKKQFSENLHKVTKTYVNMFVKPESFAKTDMLFGKVERKFPKTPTKKRRIKHCNIAT